MKTRRRDIRPDGGCQPGPHVPPLPPFSQSLPTTRPSPPPTPPNPLPHTHTGGSRLCVLYDTRRIDAQGELFRACARAPSLPPSLFPFPPRLPLPPSLPAFPSPSRPPFPHSYSSACARVHAYGFIVGPMVHMFLLMYRRCTKSDCKPRNSKISALFKTLSGAEESSPLTTRSVR